VPEPVLAARGFSYRYPEAARPALTEVSLELTPGSFTVVAGESGSGKSTLLRAASGLVPHFHGGEAEGELSVGGLDVRESGPAALAGVCGTVLQDPETQVVMGGVRAELALALEHTGATAATVARGVEEVALALGIERLLERRTETLSGGELQRVAIAAALVHRPRLLVLDEPTSQLDPVAGDELVWLLRRLNEEWGIAVLIAEHRIERCLPAADRVVALEGGHLRRDAPPAEFLRWALDSAPGLATPVARLFQLAGLTPAPVSVRQARERLRGAGLASADPAPDPEGTRRSRRRRGLRREPSALRLRGVWHELEEGPTVLRGIDLSLAPGERVALLGRNGAGKSTLLRLAKGLIRPTRGRIEAGGEVALLLQNPGDYLIHEHAEEEAEPAALARAGLSERGASHPRDLSGGERQRLALEIVLSTPAPPAVVCLDEPTRGMDRGHRSRLVRRLEGLAAGGAAVLVATHDTDFAAEWAERVVLMGEGTVIADGPAAEVLSGGWHFTTEVSRVLDGAGGALTPEQGVIELRTHPTKELVS